jgi:hypothetical protein
MSPTASSSASPPCSTEVAMLSADQCRSLRCLAEMMIPASTEYGAPSAGSDLWRHSAKPWTRCGACDRGAAKARHLVRRAVRRSRRATARCHCWRAVRYRRWGLGIPDPDHPAMLLPRRPGHGSLGMEPRAPFPKGFEVEQGDWSLLDPVRARPKLYRRELTEIGFPSGLAQSADAVGVNRRSLLGSAAGHCTPSASRS